jgi:uncharacterized protein (DUF3084 family)
MVKIVLALVIVLAVGSGVLSLRTKGTNEAIRKEALEAKQAADTAENARKKAEAAATEAAEQAAAAAKGKEDAEAAAKTAAADAEKAKGELAALSNQVAEKEKELADLKAKAEAAPAVQETPSVDLAELENKLKEAQTKLEEQQQVAASLENKSKAAEERAAALALAGEAIAFNRPLPELAAILEQCDAFVGHDSGISHLAAAVGTRSILLFGPTDPAIWAPGGNHVQVIEAPGGALGHLPPEAIVGPLSKIMIVS